jgi:TonB family protein
MIASLLQSACWFNPLTWIAGRQLRHLSEQACDDVVLGMGVDEAEYAGHLIDLARVMGTHRRQWMFAPAEAMARRSSLEGRVRAMLESKLDRKPLSTSAWIVIALALVVLAAPAAAVGVFGQGGPGSLAGTLRDPQGRLVPNADVKLLQAGKTVVSQTRTDASGDFVFIEVPAGAYDFNPGVPGFGNRHPVTVRAGQSSHADVTLRMGQLTEEITVASRKGEPWVPGSARPRFAPQYDPSADPCRAPGVSACVKPPTKIKDIRPLVPAGREGDVATVLIEAEIGIDGTVHGARLSNPTDAQLGQAGLDAVNQWVFTPTRLNGEPIPVTMTVTINFRELR